MTALILCSVVYVTAFFGFTDTADSLLERYRSTRTSLINQGGIAPGDLDAIRILRDDLSKWTSSHDDFKVVAAELQLSLWLDDSPACNTLFNTLATLQPENSDIIVAWTNFKLSQEGADPSVVWEELTAQFPGSSSVALGMAQYLDSKNRFTEAIAAIEQIDLSTASPVMLELYSDLLFADNRFKDATAALEQIDPTLLADDPALSAKIDPKLTRYRDTAKRWEIELLIREDEETADDLPRVMIITSKGPILIELFEDHAPNTVANFVSLAESGYYDGTRFHRVLPKFMAQGGDPNSREGAEGTAGSGGPGYNIEDEHTGDNIREHFAGSLSMAKTSTPHSAGSQFFLTHLPTPHLDGRHTVFGRIITGLKIARSLEQDDAIIAMTIVRKRDHDYVVIKYGQKTEKVIEPTNPKTPGSLGITTDSNSE